MGIAYKYEGNHKKIVMAELPYIIGSSVDIFLELTGTVQGIA